MESCPACGNVFDKKDTICKKCGYNFNITIPTKEFEESKFTRIKNNDKTKFWGCPYCGADQIYQDGREYCPDCKIYLDTNNFESIKKPELNEDRKRYENEKKGEKDINHERPLSDSLLEDMKNNMQVEGETDPEVKHYRSLIIQDRYEAAILVLENLTTKEPDAAELLLFCNIMCEHDSAANKLIEILIDEHLDDDTIYGIAYLFLMAGKEEKFVDMMKRAIDDDNGKELPSQASDIAEYGGIQLVLPLYEYALEKNPNNLELLEEQVDLVEEYVGETEAIVCLFLAIKPSGNDIRVWKMIGEKQQDIDNFKEAIFAYKEVLKIDPKDENAKDEIEYCKEQMKEESFSFKGIIDRVRYR